MAKGNYEESPELTPEEATRYKSPVARANYLPWTVLTSSLRVKSSAPVCRNPRNVDWDNLCRFGRYLQEMLRLVHRYWEAKRCTTATVYTDANWARDRRTRRSTSGGCMVIGIHWIKSRSKSQSLVALSSIACILSSLIIC